VFDFGTPRARDFGHTEKIMFRATIRPDLELRLLEERHAPETFALVNQDRAYLRQWLPWVDSTLAPDDTLAFIRASLERFAAGDAITAGIWYRNQFSGVIGTHNVQRLNRKIEIGYWLGEDSQGHGIVTDCCRALITHLFNELDLHRVEIHCAVSNVKSAAVPRRLGFELEGTLRDANYAGGRFHDLYVFGMLKQDWHA
jgi:ribosomal-protein-serine acetyltransferase